jgi:hypothetical protein
MSLADFLCRQGLGVDTLLASPVFCYKELLRCIGKDANKLNLILVLLVKCHIANVHIVQFFHLLVLLSISFLHWFFWRYVVEGNLFYGVTIHSMVC